MGEDFDDLYGSQYLAATDLKKPFTAAIEEIDEQDFARQGERQRMKKVLRLKGVRKPVVLNKTNALNLAEEFGKKFPEWVGKRVTVKTEDTTFQGKRTKGLRLYPAEETLPLKAPKKSQRSNELDDELPEDL
jgi:hypothetical protein